ncbi:Arc family DNA-binding protein [Thioclava sp. GXIMD4215]|uniref:Arc family DNA-binding protein n=1 Tax=Thioclava sp. GXIMD4215 TaxID=3131928 RepID=UPI0032528C41
MMARKGFPSDKQEQFMVRFPDGMRDRIKAAAEANNRSMNAEIVATLDEKYPAPRNEDAIAKRFREAIEASGIKDPHDPALAEVISRVHLELARDRYQSKIKFIPLSELDKPVDEQEGYTQHIYRHPDED